METIRARLGLSDTRFLADLPMENSGLSLQSIKDEGLSYVILRAEDHELHRYVTRKEWIYVYDENKLQGFLEQNSKTLTDAEWPTRPADFISYLTAINAPPNSALFDMIHACYGNDLATSENTLLRRNIHKAEEYEVAAACKDAEHSAQRFKAFYRNDSIAAQWLLDLAKTGRHMGAMLDTSRCYEDGRGFAQNRIEAAFWCTLHETIMAENPRKPGLADDFARCAKPDFRLTKDEQAEIKTRIAAWMTPKASPQKTPAPKQ